MIKAGYISWIRQVLILLILGLAVSLVAQVHNSVEATEVDVYQVYADKIARDSIEAGLEFLRQNAQGVIGQNMDSAILMYHWLAEEAEKHKSDSFRFYAFEALSTLYRIRGDHEKGLLYSRKTYEYIGEEDVQNKAWKLNYWGFAFMKLGLLDSAQFYLKKCHLLKTEYPEQQLISPANHLGLLYGLTGDFDLAAVYLFEALEDIPEDNNDLGKGIVLLNLASLFMRMDDLPKARKYYQITKSFARENEYHGLEVKSELGLAKISLEENNLDSSAILLDKVCSGLSYYNNTPDLANCLHLQAELSIKKGEFGAARQLLDEASRLVNEIDDEEKKVVHLMATASLHSASGNDTEAYELMKRALDNAEKYHFTIHRAEIYRWLAEYYTATGKPAAGAEFFELHIALRDTLDQQKKARLAYEMETRQLEAQKLSEILQLTQEKESAANKASLRRKMNYTLLALLVVCIGLLGFTWLSMRKNRVIARQQKDLFNKELLLKDKEGAIARMHALVDGQELERKRVATELHDGLGALIAGTTMQVQALERSDKNPGNGKIAAIRARLEEAYEEVRRISHRMMPGTLAKRSLPDAIRQLCDDLKGPGDVDIDFQVIGTAVPLDEEREMAILRIVQELLNNVTKHARATEVIAQLSYLDGEVALSVADNGVGFNKSRIKSMQTMGIQSITSRVAYLRGNLEIDTSPGKGTEVTVSLPV